MRQLKQEVLETVLDTINDIAPTALVTSRGKGSLAESHMQHLLDRNNLLERLEGLNRIGAALSKETDINQLLETILIVAKRITNADGGTLYRVTDERTLKFEIMRT